MNSNPSSERRSGNADHGERLDRWLARTFPDVSRTRFQTLIAEGRVTVEGRQIFEPRHKLSVGESVTVDIPAAAPAEPVPQPIALRIVYEDDALIVIDKP